MCCRSHRSGVLVLNWGCQCADKRHDLGRMGLSARSLFHDLIACLPCRATLKPLHVLMFSSIFLVASVGGKRPWRCIVLQAQ